MTQDIAFVLLILGAAMVLFVTNWLSADLVALLVLLSLALTGLVTPEEALSGFSNPAVITVWAVFVMSGALYRTGVARMVGQQVLHLAGEGEARLIGVIMLTSALISAVMNNVGVAALLLPVVMDIGRRTRIPASRLLMPVAYGALLGGLLTMIGTPPNLLVSGIVGSFGLEPFTLLDFTPVGVAVVVTGVAFVVVARRLLPSGHEGDDSVREEADLNALYELRAAHVVLHVPRQSALVGLTLAESRLGAALGVNVVSIHRGDQTVLAPPPDTVLQGDDRLVVAGSTERLDMLRAHRHLKLTGADLTIHDLEERGFRIAEATVAAGGKLVGESIREAKFRQRYKVQVLALKRDGRRVTNGYEDLPLEEGDRLLVLGTPDQVASLSEHKEFESLRRDLGKDVEREYGLTSRLVALMVTPDSALAGRSLGETHLGDAFGLGVVGVMRGKDQVLLADADTQLEAGDVLVVKADRRTLRTLGALRGLVVESARDVDAGDLESPDVGLSAVVLSPYTHLAGKTLREIHFREKYQLNVVAIWRSGKAIRDNLRDVELRFGDALLLHGRRDRLRTLASDRDFLVLTQEAQEPVRRDKAWIAALVMGLAFLLPVVMGWMPIQIASVFGAVLMVVTGCLRMEDAYHFIEWRAVFLIAGMLPLGIAMQTSGAAELMTTSVVATIGGYGPLAVMAGIFILTALAAQFMPSAAVAVLLAPIAIHTATDLGINPYALAMTVAIAASSSFASPVGHPANTLIMGPGGYRYSDYLRVGVPLTIVVLIVTMIVLPLVWPLVP